jgi:hypothetical protein
MFTYRCPACGKQHQVDSPFESTYDAPCLRCREIIHVTEEFVYAADGTALAPGLRAAGPGGIAERVQPATARSRRGAAEGHEEASAREHLNDPGAVEKGREAEFADQEGESKEVSLSRASPAGTTTDEADGETEKGEKPRRNGKPPPSPTEIGRRRWPLITSAAVVFVGVLGAGGYFGYNYYRKTETSPTAERKETTKAKTTTSSPKSAAAVTKGATKTASKTAPTPTTKGTPATTKAGAAKDKPQPKLEDMEPIVKARDDRVLHLSAARLAAELTANPVATNEKYKGALLEVTGLYEKTENKATVRPPLRPHIVFATQQWPILGDQLGSRTESAQWRRLPAQRPCTIRGAYGADGVLHGCNLMPLTPPADAQYKGKDLEVAGFVEEIHPADTNSPFPRLVLEGQTHTKLVVECLFRTKDNARIKEIAAETPVVVRGTCGGRFEDALAQRHVVRLDNCDLIFTSAPPADRPRLEAAQLTRAYEEDLRTDLLPASGEEPRLEGTIPVSRLESELAANSKEFEQKCRHKIVTVTGTSHPTGEVGSQLTLVTGETNAVLKVRCRFTRRLFKELDKGPTVVIRGLCMGMVNSKTLVLENCEPVDLDGRRDPRRLTADFLPHAQGQTVTYDIAQTSLLGGRPRVVRMLFEQKDDGVIETITTHVGSLRAPSLFDPTERPGAWLTGGTVRKVRLAGPSLHHRIGGGYVYLGTTEQQAKERAPETVWEPALKLGARSGETWTWSHGGLLHDYKLVKFDRYQGQPSAVIHENVATGKDPHHPNEIEHIYVKGVGEVERREYQRLSAKERRLIAERRLVDEPRP